jgi:hypothetical protein
MLEPEIDTDRIDEAVLALMFLTLHQDRNLEPWRVVPPKGLTGPRGFSR